MAIKAFLVSNKVKDFPLGSHGRTPNFHKQNAGDSDVPSKQLHGEGHPTDRLYSSVNQGSWVHVNKVKTEDCESELEIISSFETDEEPEPENNQNLLQSVFGKLNPYPRQLLNQDQQKMTDHDFKKILDEISQEQEIDHLELVQKQISSSRAALYLQSLNRDKLFEKDLAGSSDKPIDLLEIIREFFKSRMKELAHLFEVHIQPKWYPSFHQRNSGSWKRIVRYLFLFGFSGYIVYRTR